jgi:hypothetical protein
MRNIIKQIKLPIRSKIFKIKYFLLNIFKNSYIHRYDYVQKLKNKLNEYIDYKFSP